MTRHLSPAALKRKVVRAKALLSEASPLPWAHDDGHVFSKLLSDARTKAVLAKMDEKPYDVNALHLDSHVASTGQRRENSDADAELICLAVNILPHFIAHYEACRK